MHQPGFRIKWPVCPKCVMGLPQASSNLYHSHNVSFSTKWASTSTHLQCTSSVLFLTHNIAALGIPAR